MWYLWTGLAAFNFFLAYSQVLTAVTSRNPYRYPLALLHIVAAVCCVILE